MALPTSVQRQVDEATRIQEELTKKPEQDQPSPAPDESDQGHEQVKEQDDKQEQQRSNADQPAVDDKPTDQTDQEDYKKRFVNLKRMHDEVVPQLRRDNEQLRENNEHLASQLRDLTKKVDDISKSKQDTTDQDSQLTQEDIAEYGDELISMVARVSKTEMGKEIIDLKSRLENLENNQLQLKNATKQTSSEIFFSELSRLVPSWRTINASDDFKVWMADEVMPGHERQEYLEEAMNKGNVEAVAKFFTDWEALNNPSQQTSNKSQTQEKLQKKLIPENNGSSTNDVSQPVKKIYTGDEIKQFYADKTRGVYKGREEEARRIEIDILAAPNEGRVRP